MPTKEKAIAFRDAIIGTTLKSIDLESAAATELLLGTALVESRLVWRRQMNAGPARGLFQMEMATHDDIWNNFLRYRPGLAGRINALKSSVKADPETELEKNDVYAAAMARVLYLRVPTPLPAAGSLDSMATYWKSHYNTPLGGGTVSKYVEIWTGTMGA